MRSQMLKRDGRLFLHGLLPAVALTIAFALVCAAAAMVAVSNAKDTYTPVRAAVVDREDSVYNRMLVRAIAKTEYIEDVLDVVCCDEDAAMAGLQSGEFVAVVILPEGAVAGILSGTETRGRIYLSSSVEAYSEIVERVASFGEMLLAAGQFGIFSGQDLIRGYELGDQFHTEFLAEANALLLGEAIGASTSFFDVNVVAYAGTGMSTEAHFISCWIALLLMMIPLFFFNLYTADVKRPLLCRLQGAGVRSVEFMLGKMVYPVALEGLVLGLLLWLGREFFDATVTGATMVSALVGLVVSVSVSGALLMLGHRGVLIVISIVVVGILACGGIIPLQMLPDEVLAFGAITPYGVALNLLRPIFGGAVTWQSYALAGVYVCASLVCVGERLRYVRGGGGNP